MKTNNKSNKNDWIFLPEYPSEDAEVFVCDGAFTYIAIYQNGKFRSYMGADTSDCYQGIICWQYIKFPRIPNKKRLLKKAEELNHNSYSNFIGNNRDGLITRTNQPA